MEIAKHLQLAVQVGEKAGTLSIGAKLLDQQVIYTRHSTLPT